MRPYDVKSFDDLHLMESDNHPQVAEAWTILNHDDHVTLHPPANTGTWVKIPRDQFNAIVDWYMRDQPSTPQPVDGGKQGEA